MPKPIYAGDLYDLKKPPLGEGSFGVVYEGICKTSGTKWAVKESMEKYASFKECTRLREISSLMRLKKQSKALGFEEGFPHVIDLREVFLDSDNRQLYMVFAFGECDLERLMSQWRREGRRFTTNHTNYMFKQLLRGLEFVHRWYFHRDMKPENIMCNSRGTILKLIDFGQAREIRSIPPYTDYVGTRWYRAPEVQLAGVKALYSSPADMWSAGCILAELIEDVPLFPATSEIDLIHRMVDMLGVPTQSIWPQGYQVVDRMKVKKEADTPKLFESLHKASETQLGLLKSLLLWNQTKRLTARQALDDACMAKVPDAYSKFTDSVPGMLSASDLDGIITDSSNPGRLSSSNLSMGAMAQVLRATKLFQGNARRARVVPEGRKARKSWQVMDELIREQPKPEKGEKRYRNNTLSVDDDQVLYREASNEAEFDELMNSICTEYGMDPFDDVLEHTAKDLRIKSEEDLLYSLPRSRRTTPEVEPSPQPVGGKRLGPVEEDPIEETETNLMRISISSTVAGSPLIPFQRHSLPDLPNADLDWNPAIDIQNLVEEDQLVEGRPPALEDLTPSQAAQERKVLKRAIKKFEREFIQRNDHEPNTDDKRRLGLRGWYKRYQRLKRIVEK